MGNVPSIRESLLLGALKRLGADRREDAQWLADQVAALVERLQALEAKSRMPPDFTELGWLEVYAWLDEHGKALAELVQATVEAAPVAAFLALEVALKGAPRKH